MASLRDKLNKVKVGGSLQRVSGEELQALSEASGRTAPPTSPVETGVIGGSPDQAKMAGTPAQKSGALRVSIQEGQSLQERLRTGQPRRERTAEEEQRAERAGRLEGLGSLGDRVQALTQKYIQEATAAEGDGQLQLSQDALEGVDESLQSEFEQKLIALQSDPTNFQLTKDINNMLGVTDVANMIPADQLVGRYLSATEQVGSLTAESFQDMTTLEDLDVTQLGFQNVGELADLLGMDPAELGTTNIRQLIEETEAQIAQEFTQAEELRRRAEDLSLGAAERAEARAQLREMGATGIKKVESTADELAQQIQDGDVIEFAGEEMRIDEMLDDEYLSGLTKRYLESDPEDPFRQQLEESEPELTSWINKNSEVLEKAVQDIEEGVSEFAQLQYENQSVAMPVVGGKLSDEIMKEVFPDWGELKTEQYNIDEVPFLKILNDETYPDKSGQASVRRAVDRMAEVSPKVIPELSRMTEAELDKYGVTDQNSDSWRKYDKYLSDAQRVMRANPADPDSVSQAAFGKGVTFDEANKNLEEAEIRERTGLFGTAPTSKHKNYLGVTGQGTINDPAALKDRLDSVYMYRDIPWSIKDAIDRNVPSLSEDYRKLSSYNSAQNDLYNAVKHAFQRDVVVDSADMEQITKGTMRDAPYDKLEELYTSPIRDRMDADATKKLEGEFRQRFDSKISDFAGQDVNNLLSSKIENSGDAISKSKALRDVEGKLRAQLSVTDGATRPLQSRELQRKLQQIAERQKKLDLVIAGAVASQIAGAEAEAELDAINVLQGIGPGGVR